MTYQWDVNKARQNLAKHRVDFADAALVFEDEWALTLENQQIEGEHRFVTLGRDAQGRVLVVIYTYRGDKLRLISARRATPSERTHYERRIRF